jgi:hypothetical protein
MEEAAGEIVIDFKLRAAPVTRRDAAAWIPAVCALMVTLPTAAPVTSPFALTPATFASEEFQVTELLKSEVVPSER